MSPFSYRLGLSDPEWWLLARHAARGHQASKALIYTTVSSPSSSAASREVNAVTKIKEHTSARAGWEGKGKPQYNSNFPGHERGMDTIIDRDSLPCVGDSLWPGLDTLGRPGLLMPLRILGRPAQSPGLRVIASQTVPSKSNSGQVHKQEGGSTGSSPPKSQLCPRDEASSLCRFGSEATDGRDEGLVSRTKQGANQWSQDQPIHLLGSNGSLRNRDGLERLTLAWTASRGLR